MNINNKIIKLKDNSKKKLLENDVNSLKEIAGKTISNVKNNIIIFPNSIKESKDLEEENKIFDIINDSICTNNIMGFISYKNIQIKISSRFANDDNDYFLHYMLMKVLNLNIINLEHSKDYDDSFDFLIYMFISFFKKALRQGLFKQYKSVKHNDANIKGIIDINRYIKNNIPFNGKISYNTREYSYDNNITQLIRHTIEYINIKNRYILNYDNEIKNYVQQIFYSASNYDRNKRESIINKNLKKLSHPYYYEYEPLRKICIQILRHEKLKYGSDDNTVYGLLFDGAWLFEEYLNTFLSKINFIHAENRKSKNGINLLNNAWRVYPDFYKLSDDNKNNIVLDAKYKRLDNYSSENIDRNDKHQIVSYAYTLNAKNAGFIYPLEETNYTDKNKIIKIGILNNVYNSYANCTIYKYALKIPNQNFNNIKEFSEAMKSIENELKEYLK
ncbi:McrC family protein [Brachyspira hampsonii]|uniref:5-methylcytosine restriction system component-like protein n=1 Tax=Brachyspira hampsonii 30446 TaxID=1289135 RepID=A0A2U4EY09_9SPIR|nr:5-methylcytosine restriction system component- like protein [Brachyspira hampsonii]EKV58238.1 5-methylcytosine restriction system component- like protein [Brachyspira hampsonii 30446]MBW5389420.1 restriction endonuclease [Brachyspira hampsonii]MBW5395461.1 restriction endonuclease [Brachyspira hampsonii]OEJ20224.1 restriction endonuclease [Brachyspira hampsonii]